ncbi:cysteine desulfurase NifS, partial [Microbacterium arthrosphaerae]
ASGETLLFLLDRAGIAVSTGSACQAGVPEPSHVVLAMGRTDAEARQVLRFTLGRTTVDGDVAELLAVLPGAVERARAATRR